MKALEKLSDFLDRICATVIVFMIGAMVIITTAQIICRTWFTSLTWSDEVTRYLLIWSTFLGATCVYRHSGNISITFIQESFPPKVTKILKILVQLVCLLLFAVLCWYGFQYTGKLKKTATSFPLEMKYIFLCVPISMAICMVHALTLLLEEVIGKPEEGKEEKG